MAIDNTFVVLKFEYVVDAFLGEEMWTKVSISSKEALIVRGRFKEKGMKNEKQDKSKFKWRFRFPRAYKVMCWNCVKSRHFRKNCKKEKSKKKFDSNLSPRRKMMMRSL